jgi:UDP-N-acetylmuramate dehydrogenase
MNILENVSLKNYNTFGIDAKAGALAEVFSVNELQKILLQNDFKDSRRVVIGGGSNILFSKDVDGLLIKNSIPGINIIDENNSTVLIEAGAGVNWHDLVTYCVNNNFGGIENLSLIPGTAGAAPLQNIGAYGQELKDTFFSLRGIFVKNLTEKNFFKKECNFGYRNSIFKNELKGKFIITYITLRLLKNPEVNLNYASLRDEIEKLHLQVFSIRDVSNIVCEIRRSKLPDPAVIGNAGSFFKNPEIDELKFDELKKEYPDIRGYNSINGKVKLSAGWLIERCGWKGKRLGNVGSYSKQSLVIVNYGGATGEEILEFAKQIKNSVHDRFGISLQEEVNIY